MTRTGPVSKSLLVATLLSAACTRPLRLANSPLPASEPLLLQPLSWVFRDWPLADTVYVADSTMAFEQSTVGLVRGYWADSARAGFTLAIADLVAKAPGPIRPAIAGLFPPGVVLGRRPQRPVGTLPGTQARLSNFGFSPDSSFAVVYVEIRCGGLCGNGSLYFFARRPGYRWILWDTHTFWVS